MGASAASPDLDLPDCMNITKARRVSAAKKSLWYLLGSPITQCRLPPES
jgi:hypothetical protein